MSQSNESARGQGQSLLLTDPHRLAADIALIGRAVAEEWDVPNREEIVTRLRGIVAKTEVGVMTKEGPINLEGPADANAIAAARVLTAMVGQNQTERHKQLDKQKPDLHAHLHGAAGSLKPQESDPEYLEFLRTRAISGDGHTGIICPSGEQRTLENGASPRTD